MKHGAHQFIIMPCIKSNTSGKTEGLKAINLSKRVYLPPKGGEKLK